MKADSHFDNDAQQTFPVLNGQPTWDLAAPTIAYPLGMQVGGRFYEVYVHLKPYPADALISILNSVPGSYRRNSSNVEMFNGDDSPYSKLTDLCFVRLEGTQTDNPDLHRRWLDQNPRQKVRIARDLLGGIDIDSEIPHEVPADEDDRLQLLPIALECGDVKIRSVQELWDGKHKTKIRMTHTLASDTEDDWRRWTRTGNETFHKARREWKSTINWWKRLELYDHLIMSVDGMSLNGAACTSANKAAWVPLVPAWHKLLVVTSVFDETRVKNG